MEIRSTLLGEYNDKFVKHYNKYSENLLKRNELVHFMNLGYIGEEQFNIKEEDTKSIASVNLYLKVLEGLNTNPVSALEVGSGLGGGCYILKKYLQISEVTGVDYGEKNVIYSNHKFNGIGIDFKHYSSSNFNQLNQTYDLILSLEASQHFDNWELFIENAYKVLNKDGILVYADLFYEKDIEKILKILDNSPLKMVIQEDISAGVIHSIAQMKPPNKNVAYRLWCAINGMNKINKFEAYNNSAYHKMFQNGSIKYLKFHLKK